MYKRQIYQIAESNRNFFLPELECSTTHARTYVRIRAASFVDVKNVGEKVFLNVKTLQNTENARRCLLLSYVRYWKRENKNERLKRDDKRHSHVAVK